MLPAGHGFPREASRPVGSSCGFGMRSVRGGRSYQYRCRSCPEPRLGTSARGIWRASVVSAIGSRAGERARPRRAGLKIQVKENSCLSLQGGPLVEGAFATFFFR